MDYIAESQDLKGLKTNWFEVLPAEVGTNADRTSEIMVASTAQGVIFELVIANVAGGATFAATVVTPDAYGGSDLTLKAFAALGANGSYILTFSPLTLAAFGQEAVVGALPREWKLFLNHNAVGSADTKVSARYFY